MIIGHPERSEGPAFRKSKAFAALTMTIVVFTGCGGFMSVTPRGAGPMQAGGPNLEPPVGPTGGTVRPPATVGGRAIGGAGTRTICRHEGTPGGFVATQYTSLASCPILADSSRVDNAKIVLDLRPLAAGTSVLMCRDQSIPRGWYMVSSPDNEDVCGTSRTKPVKMVEIRKGG